MSRHSARSHEYRQNRAIVLARDPICVLCRVRPSVEADHIVPTSLGGSDSVENLRGTCKQCNGKRGNRTMVRTTYLAPGWFG